MSSTRYVHYGKITATLRRWGGVVTAFITMSNIKDENRLGISRPQHDYRPGELFLAGKHPSMQQNHAFAWDSRMTTNGQHDSGVSTTGISDTHSNYYAYAIDWQPDPLTLLVDSNVVRTVNKTDTVDEWRSPLPNNPIVHPNQAESKVMSPITALTLPYLYSHWPAGVNSSAPGTIEWAGGLINWQDSVFRSLLRTRQVCRRTTF